LYSIGAITYYLFTGKHPPLAVNFQDDMEEAIFKVANSRLGWYRRSGMNVVDYQPRGA